DGWGTMIRSTCPVIVQTVRAQYPELIPYLAPVATPIAAEARYLKSMYGAGTQVVYAGVCITEGGLDVDAAITLDDLTALLEQRKVRIDQQEPYFSRLPEERRRHWSTAGGLPVERRREERHGGMRFRQVRGRGARGGLGWVRLWDVSGGGVGGGARAHLPQVVPAVPRQDGDAGAASGGRRRPDGARHVPGAAGPAVERGGAERPDRPAVCRVVRGPG